jgi:dihydroorotase-like cyclic amidohydrolase
MPHLDTLGPFVGWLIQECGFSYQRIAQILSSEPAKIMAPNLERRSGAILQGYTASFSLLDFSRATTVRNADNPNGNRSLFTRCGWSPFQTISLPAFVVKTIIDGRSFDLSPVQTNNVSLESFQ